MENKKIKNKIITLSGEPVSGKGTTVKKLIERLKEQGYTDEQIHLESTGNDFRRYFNSIIDFINNLDNEEQLQKIINREELQEFFSNEEYRKILSSTIAELKKKKVDLSTFKIEKANNDEDFKYIRKIIDTLIDERMKGLGKQINQEEHPDEIWIIDSRLAFHNIPESFSVRLTTNAQVAGERLFNDKSRGKEDSQYNTIEEAIKEREDRKNGENNRYLKRYGVNLKDENNYNLVIDTSYSTPDDIADVILQCEKYYEEEKEFAKKWASPKIFLPLQSERRTLERGSGMYNFEELANYIKENEYIPSEAIEVINVDGYNYIIEGHHRNFGAAYAGKTLIPYEIIARDDEEIPCYNGIARNRADSIDSSYLYGHEWILQQIDKDFSYEKMFPEVFQKIEEMENSAR